MLVSLLSPNAKDKKAGNTSKLLEPPKTRNKIDNDTSDTSMVKETMSDTETKETKTCRTCEETKPIAEYRYQKDYKKGEYTTSSKCKACFSEQVKANKKRYYQTNKEHHAKYNADPEIKARRNQRLKERKKTDPHYRINESLKVRIHEILQGYKNCRSSALLDCTRDHLHKWLELNFDDSMTWDNFGAHWHIDHVIPVSFFDNTNKDQQRLCFHWSNLRPLRKDLNISKSNKIDEVYIRNHFASIQQFCEQNQGYQVDAERCLWQRFELWYGNNPRDDASFVQKLKWATSSQGPNPVTDEGTDKVQRLNASGLELANPQQ
jgi:hypothetical protein